MPGFATPIHQSAKSPRSWVFTLALGTIVIALLYAADPLREGLTATFFADPNWSAAIERSLVDNRLSTEGVYGGWRGRPPRAFSTTWSGALFVVLPGTYTFATVSDDGSSVYVDRELVVDNGGPHDRRMGKGQGRLTAGVHTLFVKYFQAGGPFEFELLWARGDGPLGPLPAWALAPRPVGGGRFLASVVVRRAVRWSFWLWMAIAIASTAIATWRAAVRYVRAPFVPSVEAWLLAGGALMLFFVLPHRIE